MKLMGVSEGEGRDNGAENIFEKILAKKSPNLSKYPKHREFQTE